MRKVQNSVDLLKGCAPTRYREVVLTRPNTARFTLHSCDLKTKQVTQTSHLLIKWN